MPKCIITLSGTKIWLNENAKFHREDGPAIEYPNGTKYWYLNGKIHREDGPALEWFTGAKAWYYKGECIQCYSQEEFYNIIRTIKLKPFWK